MSNRPKTASLEFEVPMLTGLYMDLLAYETKDDHDCYRATKITEKFDEIEGFDFNPQTGRIRLHIGYCPKCEADRAGNDGLTDTGECRECGAQTEEARPVFVKLNGKDIELLWDIVKQKVKGKRKVADMKRVKGIAKTLGKTDAFETMVMPDEDEEETEDAGTGTDTSPEAEG